MGLLSKQRATARLLVGFLQNIQTPGPSHQVALRMRHGQPLWRHLRFAPVQELGFLHLTGLLFEPLQAG